MLSIIIPAHNEETVIGRCISAITGRTASGELEVIVACNGCTDNTAEVARAAGEQVTVIETPVASKSNALNLGDQVAGGFPRFYVDADVILPIESIREVTRVLNEGRALAAAPLMQVDLTDRPWTVRVFYKVWVNLPYCRRGMIGSGVYALSEEGRKRFDRFPPVTADDAFVRLHFRPEERMTVETCTFTIRAPRTLSSLIAIKTRSHFGNRELKARFPHLWHNEDSAHGSALSKFLWRPTWWPAIGVYLYVKLASRARAWWRCRFGDHKKWERDETSRQPVPAGSQA